MRSDGRAHPTAHAATVELIHCSHLVSGRSNKIIQGLNSQVDEQQVANKRIVTQITNDRIVNKIANKRIAD